MMVPTHSPPTMRQEVHALLLCRVPLGLISTEATCKALNISAETLSRRLQFEGVNYPRVLAEVRYELAESWLRDPSMSVREISALLSYPSPEAFRTDFQSWTHQSPESWRSGR